MRQKWPGRWRPCSALQSYGLDFAHYNTRHRSAPHRVGAFAGQRPARSLPVIFLAYLQSHPLKRPRPLLTKHVHRGDQTFFRLTARPSKPLGAGDVIPRAEKAVDRNRASLHPQPPFFDLRPLSHDCQKCSELFTTVSSSQYLTGQFFHFGMGFSGTRKPGHLRVWFSRTSSGEGKGLSSLAIACWADQVQAGRHPWSRFRLFGLTDIDERAIQRWPRRGFIGVHSDLDVCTSGLRPVFIPQSRSHLQGFVKKGDPAKRFLFAQTKPLLGGRSPFSHLASDYLLAQIC